MIGIFKIRAITNVIKGFSITLHIQGISTVFVNVFLIVPRIMVSDTGENRWNCPRGRGAKTGLFG
jgi:hypothetical protein